MVYARERHTRWTRRLLKQGRSLFTTCQVEWWIWLNWYKKTDLGVAERFASELQLQLCALPSVFAKRKQQLPYWWNGGGCTRQQTTSATGTSAIAWQSVTVNFERIRDKDDSNFAFFNSTTVDDFLDPCQWRCVDDERMLLVVYSKFTRPKTDRWIEIQYTHHLKLDKFRSRNYIWIKRGLHCAITGSLIIASKANVRPLWAWWMQM